MADSHGRGIMPQGQREPWRGGLSAPVKQRRECGSTARPTVAGVALLLTEADWPEPRVVRVLASVAGLATVSLAVDGPETTTTRQVLPGIAAAWPVPGGWCRVTFTPTASDPNAQASASISPGVGSTWTQGDVVVLPPLGVLALDQVPGLTQLIDVQVLGGALSVAGGTPTAPPDHVTVVPTVGLTAVAGLAGATVSRVFRLYG